MNPSNIKKELYLERKRLLLFTHLLALAIYAFFIPYDYFVEAAPRNALIESATFVLILLSLYLLLRLEMFTVSAFFILSLVGAEILFSISEVINRPAMTKEIYWSIILAPAAFYLTGRGGGVAVSVVMLASVWLIYYLKSRQDEMGTGLSLMVDYSGVYLVMTVISYLYARSQSLNIRRMMHYSRNLAFANDELKVAALTDTLTRTYNRKFLDEILHELAGRSAGNVKFSLIMFDIDHFKQVNDNHGHQVGDEILGAVTRVTRSKLRDNDILGRWGGEEFMIISPGMGAEDALGLAERLRVFLQDYEFPYGLNIRCSFGVAEIEPYEGPDRLIERVDEALYLAKKSGRNQTRLSQAPRS